MEEVQNSVTNVLFTRMIPEKFFGRATLEFKIMPLSE
jgi:hypothetical protein